MTTYTYFNIDYPLAVGNIFAQGINDTGQIVGWYGGGGFLYSGGTYTTLNDPSVTGTNTFAYGINDASQIVGYYGGGDNGGYHGFLYSGAVYTNIDNPSTPNNTYPQGINNLSQIVGFYGDASGAHGFLYSGGVFTTLNDPLGTNGTYAEGINDQGQIVGLYSDGFVHAFLYDNGIYTTLPDLPRAYGINDAGDVVGGGSVLYSDGTFTTLPGPTGDGVGSLGINNMGQIVGFYTDGGRQHGFVADPNPVMSDAVKAQGSLTTLNGTSVGDGTVSAYDGTQLIGTTTAASDGTWSLQAHLTGGAIHSFTETATDLQGNAASSAGVTLYSTSQNKSLLGGTGDDVLIGDKGDKLTGGAGADTFVFNPNLGKETVTDFKVSQDILTFDHTLFTNPTASQVLSQAHDTSAGAVIAVDAHDTVTLTGVTVAQLQSLNFHFF